MDAKEFLEKHGLSQLTKLIVEDNKFHSLADLQLLADNRKFLDSIAIPVCWQIKFVSAIEKLKNDSGVGDEMSTPIQTGKKNSKVHVPVDEDDVVETSKDPVATSTPKKSQEISKKQLLELSKKDMTAQAINIKYNELNKFLLAEMRRAEGKWKGAGGLKRCEKTNEDEARANMQLADDIVDNPALNKWYGTYPIGEHGVFLINRAKAKMLLARKLSQERKPSAYKRKIKVNKSEDEENSNKGGKSMRLEESEEVEYEDNQEEEDPITVSDDKTETLQDEIPVKTSASKKPANKTISEYESKRLKRMQENDLELLKNEMIPTNMAMITALFYLKASKIADVKVVSLKKVLTSLGIRTSGQNFTKDQMVVLLGKELFAKGKVRRKDPEKVITKDNLVLAN